jgi:putative iron-regulated protein
MKAATLNAWWPFFCAVLSNSLRLFCSRFMSIKPYIFFSVTVLFIVGGCVEKGCIDPAALNYNASAERDDQSCEYGDKNSALKDSILVNHANIASALYADALLSSVALDSAISKFMALPTDDGFSKAKLAWRNAHASFMLCEALRYSNGPIDDDRYLYNYIGDWPIQPNIIDYTVSSKKGIINNPSLLQTISGSELIEYGNSRAELTTGFHVIEFLLWGEDTSDVSALIPGLRPFTDYDLTDTMVLNASRRNLYLKECSKLLVSQLSDLEQDWQALTLFNYRSEFVALNSSVGLKNILRGLALTASEEIAEKAMINPIKSRDPMDEISVFSDNSQIDIVAAVNGLQIIYNGEHAKSAQTIAPGTSIHDLMLIVDPALEEQVQLKLTELTESVATIPTPFDWQIAQEDYANQGPVMQTAILLNEFESLMQDVARANGFGLSY